MYIEAQEAIDLYNKVKKQKKNPKRFQIYVTENRIIKKKYLPLDSNEVESILKDLYDRALVEEPDFRISLPYNPERIQPVTVLKGKKKAKKAKKVRKSRKAEKKVAEVVSSIKKNLKASKPKKEVKEVDIELTLKKVTEILTKLTS